MDSASKSIVSKFEDTVPNIKERTTEVTKNIKLDAERAILARTTKRKRTAPPHNSPQKCQKNFQRVPSYRGPRCTNKYYKDPNKEEIKTIKKLRYIQDNITNISHLRM